MRPAVTVTRRTVLAACLVLVAGCRHKAAPPTAQADPDASALTTARATEAALIAACQAAGEVDEAGIHRNHLTALGGAVATASPTPAATTSIKALLSSSAASLRSVAIAAVDGRHAAVLASIAASHEVLARV